MKTTQKIQSGFACHIGGEFYKVDATKAYVLYAGEWLRIQYDSENYMHILFRNKIRWIDDNKLFDE